MCIGVRLYRLAHRQHLRNSWSASGRRGREPQRRARIAKWPAAHLRAGFAHPGAGGNPDREIWTLETQPQTADAFIIAVPTPFYEDKKADMRFVISAAEAIVPSPAKGNLVVLESTSPPPHHGGYGLRPFSNNRG